MQSEVSPGVQKVFETLYCKNLPDRLKQVLRMTDLEKHLLFEQTRRCLDISKNLHRQFPIAMPYIIAHLGERIVFDIYSSIINHADGYYNVRSSTTATLIFIVEKLSNTSFNDLIKYELLVQSGQSLRAVKKVKYTSGMGKIAIDSKYSIADLYMSLSFYNSCFAPSIFYENIHPEHQETIVLYA